MFNPASEIVSDYLRAMQPAIKEAMREAMYNDLDRIFDKDEVVAELLPDDDTLKALLSQAIADLLLPF